MNRARDLVNKRGDYAKARIPEYWIVDPDQLRVIVLTLRDGDFVAHGEFTAGATATSVYLPEFTVVVDDLFRSASGQA